MARPWMGLALNVVVWMGVAAAVDSIMWRPFYRFNKETFDTFAASE